MIHKNYPCAMAGFGRSTERFRVINLVYVPKDLRGAGIGRELISRMTSMHALWVLKNAYFLVNGRGKITCMNLWAVRHSGTLRNTI